ncbi:hypothetical protein CBR_g34738 [Chara braunii]|uniref:Uncharacterized protein n=1 Tax=Chara braunii TaxID=69332 RepID=A0A388JZ02_CHABU|nr:hypothetical protein CBR_g34738 [Chara braunii]|eukprot:GBG63039.1 hypothetical protein CBR_g34738 [Chara braunii]
MAVRRLSAPGVSHVSTVVLFSSDISAISPLQHTAIWTSLREWGQQLAAKWNKWLTRRGDNLVPTDGIDVGGLRTSRHEPAVVLPELLTWTRDIEHRAWIAYVELLIIQAWRTEAEGDLLGFLFGSVRPGHRQQIVQELTIPLAQLVDDLPLEIVSQIIGLAFFQPRTASEDEGLTLEEEEEEGVEEGDEEEEEETSEEEGSYNEYSEEESGGDEEEEEEEEEDQMEEEEECEWETLGEEADRAETQEEDPEAVRRREDETAAGKQPLEFVSGVDLSIPNDPAKDPEPPKNDDGDLAAETSSAPARRRRRRSPSPSTSARPPVRARTDTGHRALSPVLIPSSP